MEAFPNCTVDRIAKERELMVSNFIMEQYLRPLQDKQDDDSSFYQFICPLCFKLMQRCVTTVCGHSFCEYCLDEYLIYKETCFVCDFKAKKQTKLRDKPLISNFKVDDIIVQIVDNCQVDAVKQDWQNRKKVMDEKVAKKKLGKIEIDSVVDMRDTNYIWCEASITLIIE